VKSDRHAVGRALALGAGLIALAGLAACNEILGLDEGKPRPTSSSTGAGGADCDPATTSTSSTSSGEAAWSCIGSVEPLCATDIGYVFDFTDNDSPAQGISVSVCRANDEACADPVMTGLSPTGNGTLGITLPSSFDGYLYVESSKYKPTIVEIGPPTSITPFTRKVPMFGQAGFSALLVLYGVTEDPARGSVGIFGLDCDRNPAPGVTFVVDGTDSETQSF
jgi:hypothetical protein